MRTWRLALVLVLISLAATGVSAASVRLVAFETVAKGLVANGAGPKHPTVYVVRDEADAARVSALISPPDTGKLQSVDLARHGVLAVFSGVKPATGFSVRVKRISLEAGVLRIV